MKKSFYYFLMLSLIIPLFSSAQQETQRIWTYQNTKSTNTKLLVQGKSIDYGQQKLAQTFLRYDLYQIDFSQAKTQARNNNELNLTLQMGEKYEWDITLYLHDLRSPDYKEYIGMEKGVEEVPRRRAITYKGILNNREAAGEEVRLNIAESFINGYVTIGGKEIFIESLSLTEPNAPKDYYVVYRPEDIRSDGEHKCTAKAAEKSNSYHKGEVEFDLQKNRMACFEAEIATACTWDFVQIQGTPMDANDRIIAITNLVEGLYAPFMLDYIIVGQFAPASMAADPFTTSDIAEDLLDAMQAYAGPNLPTHDLGQIWTGRDIRGCYVGPNPTNTGLIGCAMNIGDVCGDERYNVCENWNGNTNCLRTLSAHEFGHTWDGVHGQSAAGSIMTPTINCNATTFTAGNTTRIQAHIDTRNCLDACCPLTVSCALITDQTLSCRADLPPVDFDLPLIIESCGDVTLSALTIIPGNSGCPGDEVTITRTYFIQDAAGNMDQCMQTFTVISNMAPTITCPASQGISCASDIVVSADNAIVTAECGTPSVSLSGPVINGTPDCIGTTYTYTYTVTDFCNRMASCEQVFTIVSSSISISCDPDEVVECEADINPMVGDVNVTTNCNVGFDVDITGPVIFGQEGCDGTVYQYTYTATSVCGLSTSCTRSYTLDNNGPTISCPAGIQIVECEEDIVVDPSDATVTTSCGLDFDVVIDAPEISGTAGCNTAFYKYAYTVTDECGRTASCARFFQIMNDGPTIVCPPGEVVECREDIIVNPNNATVTTSCDYGFDVTISGPVIDGEEGCPGTTYTYTYRVLDECGRAETCEQVFTNGANDGPTITCPASQIIECAYQINVNPAYAVVETSCKLGYEVTVSDPVISGSPDCPGATYTYVYTVEDACGRTANCSRTFTIANEGPELECPDLLFLNCEDYQGGALQAKIQAWLGSVSAKSSCGLPLGVNNNFNPNNLGMCLNNPFTNVTFFATDNCGRTGSCTGTIVMVDTEEPEVLQEAENGMADCYDNYQGAFQAWLADRGGAVIVDACWDNLSWSTIPSFPTINCNGGMGSTTVTFRAADGCGNFTTTTATFMVMAGDADMTDNTIGDEADNSLGGDMPEVDQSEMTINELATNPSAEIAESMVLYQNRPNPFRAETTISFFLPESSSARLTIYDMNGRLLKLIEGDYTKGYNEVQLQSSDIAGSGVLFYRLDTATETSMKKMIILK